MLQIGVSAVNQGYYDTGVEWLLEARERLDRNSSAVSESLADTRIMEAKKLHDHYLDHRY